MTKTLICFTEGVPQRGKSTRVEFLLASLIDKKEQTFRDAIYQLIFMRFLYRKLQKSSEVSLENLSISTRIDDVVFVDVVSNRYYESEEQRKILMEHFNVRSNHPGDSRLHHSQAGGDGGP